MFPLLETNVSSLILQEKIYKKLMFSLLETNVSSLLLQEKTY